jgi:hypothetical protein
MLRFKHSARAVGFLSLALPAFAQSDLGDVSIERLGFVHVAKITNDEIDRKITGAQYSDYYIRVTEFKKTAELLSVNMPGNPRTPQLLLASYLVDCEKGAIRLSSSQQFDALWNPQSPKAEMKGARWELPVPKEGLRNTAHGAV